MMSIWFFIFLKLCTDIVEIGKRQVKINRLNYIAILSKFINQELVHVKLIFCLA